MNWGDDNSDVSILADLNKAVKDAIENRRKWLDNKMDEYSDIHVGDIIKNSQTGEVLGKVTRLYRYWQDRDGGVRDTHMSIHYEYEISPGNFDNTSRQYIIVEKLK